MGNPSCHKTYQLGMVNGLYSIKILGMVYGCLWHWVYHGFTTKKKPGPPFEVKDVKAIHRSTWSIHHIHWQMMLMVRVIFLQSHGFFCHTGLISRHDTSTRPRAVSTGVTSKSWAKSQHLAKSVHWRLPSFGVERRWKKHKNFASVSSVKETAQTRWVMLLRSLAETVVMHKSSVQGCLPFSHIFNTTQPSRSRTVVVFLISTSHPCPRSTST